MKFPFYSFLTILLFVLVLVIWITYPQWVLISFTITDNPEFLSKLGTFGDSFGALNTLFAGLAFTGIIISIFLQSKELRETRKEFKEQKDQFIIQSQSLVKQTFENTFFQLLHLQNDITGSVIIKEQHYDSDVIYSGKKAFQELFDKFSELQYIATHKTNDHTSTSYFLFYEQYHNQVGHYFRNIYQILKYIENSDIENKKFYSNLLRAQLSNYELALLFYNCTSNLSKSKFRPLLEKNQFFEHLPVFDIFQKDDIALYDKNAFGDSPRWQKYFSEKSND